ncbi:glycosyltransferase family 39 protein [Kitasatospora sp. NPDC097643]|uniref:glycosyltransferase family 39 protein n=1 Tax=Kitasatospora sp. NPDC097643 TaxID=3157230 RepID=UPI00331ED473
MAVRGDEPGTDPVMALPAFAVRPVAGVAGGVAAVLLLLSGRYGFHRDELYFRVAAQHLDWGYVDQPPLTPLLARVSTLFGDGPTALRVIPALLTAAGIVLVALLAREFGSGRAGQLLAACAAALSAYVLAVGHLLLTSTVDVLIWLAVCLAALRLLRTGEGRWWPVVGACAGIGLQNKDLVLLLGAALVPAVLYTGPRQVLRGWWPVAGLLLASVIAAPNLWWQAAHGWPELTVAGGISDQDGLDNRLMFVPMQILYLSPVLVSIWLAGFRRLRDDPALRWARAFGYAYPLLCLLVLASGGKPYYALPLLLVLTAAGCEPVVRRAWTPQRRRGFAAWLAFGAALNLVITLPVLPPRLIPTVNWIYREQGEQFGWPRLAAAAADGWRAVPPELRSRTVVFATNYGEAGALAEYGPGLGLPAPYSGHMSFADWGPPPDSADGPVLLVHPDKYPAVEREFTGCRVVARVDNGADVGNEEQHTPILICTGTTAPWSQLWPRLRQFY